jgi:dTDP-glucose 4,6-dehydratase
MVNQQQPKTCVITGVAGFLGSHMADRLLQEGFRVVGLDNFLTGNERNIENLRHHERFTFVESDVTEHITIDEAVSFVLHFAAPASPKDYEQIPHDALRAGYLGTYNALGLTRHKGAVFFLASSPEVYGIPETSTQPEEYVGRINHLGETGLYDVAKLAAESLAMAYHKMYELEVRIARIFSTYGPRMRTDDGRAVSTFVSQALSDRPLTIKGDGGHRRSFCYVADVVEGMYRLLLSGCNIPVNLGSPHDISVLNLARKVKDAADSSATIEFLPAAPEEPIVRKPDISLARKLLDWEPSVSLDEGLRATVEWFRQYRANGGDGAA